MAAYRVLISCPTIHDYIHDYADEFAAHDIAYDVPDVEQQLTESELLDVLPGYDGLLCADDELSERVLRQANDLKVISKWGIGIDNINLDVADELDIAVYNTPGTLSAEVANVIIGYTIMLTRKLHRIDRAVRDGNWWCPRGVSLDERTFGVIGVGNIGSEVARRAHAFGMDVLGNDIDPLPDDLKAETGIESVERDELLDRSDIVSLNCALTPKTRGLIGAKELDRIGPNGYLINTARGELIDQPELVSALRNDRLAGAALDVFESEPLPADSPLVDMENVILGSHNAQNTLKAVTRVNDKVVSNLIYGLVEK